MEIVAGEPYLLNYCCIPLCTGEKKIQEQRGIPAEKSSRLKQRDKARFLTRTVNDNDTGSGFFVLILKVLLDPILDHFPRSRLKSNRGRRLHIAISFCCGWGSGERTDSPFLEAAAAIL